MLRNRQLLLSAVATSVLALDAGPATAQLEEVLVTARKREESIMKVPVIASVVSQEQIEQYSVGDLHGISDRVPGLVIGSATMSFGSQVSLRGLGTSTLNATVDQSVSLNIDGMQMTQGLAYAAGMFDLANVEVLKGPQALFYGKASPGGVISIATADPGGEFAASIRHGYEAGANENRSDLVISGPVSDKLGVRLAATFTSQDGYFHNEAQADPQYGAAVPKYRNLAEKEEWVIRLTTVWQASEQFQAKLKLNATDSKVDGDGGGLQFVSCPDGVSAPSGIPFLGGGEDCKLDDKLRIVDLSPEAFIGIRNNGVPFLFTEQQFGSLDLQYDLNPELSLTSVSGFYMLDQSSMINGTMGTFAAAAVVADPDFSREDFTQEFRLSSDYASALNFTAGLFYQEANMSYRNNVLGNTTMSIGPEQLVALPFELGLGQTLNVVPLPAQIQLGYQTVDIKALSAFAQLVWNISPELELAFGARWTDEERQHKVWDDISGERVRINTATPILSVSDISPELTLTYTPSDELTVFGALKQALKSGSFDTVLMPVDGDEVAFGDEEISGGEFGFKSRLLDNSLQVEAAAYFYQYSDLQVGANENQDDGTLVIRTLNAASADVYGLELIANYMPPALPNLNIYGALNYNKSEYSEFDNAPCWGGQMISEGCDRLMDSNTGLFTAQDLSGGELMRAPAWQANFGASYELPIWQDMSLALGWNTVYSSSYYTNLLLRDDMQWGSYFKHNASAALRGRDERWEAALIVNNIADELTSGNCVNANFANGAVYGGVETGGDSRGSAGVEELACNIDAGRQVWLRLAWSFE